MEDELQADEIKPPACRWCLQHEPDANLLVSPCNCTGESGDVHWTTGGR